MRLVGDERRNNVVIQKQPASGRAAARPGRLRPQCAVAGPSKGCRTAPIPTRTLHGAIMSTLYTVAVARISFHVDIKMCDLWPDTQQYVNMHAELN